MVGLVDGGSGGREGKGLVGTGGEWVRGGGGGRGGRGQKMAGLGGCEGKVVGGSIRWSVWWVAGSYSGWVEWVR